MVSKQLDELPLTAAALQLGISWQRAWRLVLTGEISGSKRGGRWFVDTVSLEQFGESASKHLGDVRHPRTLARRGQKND
jgi:hypothetical protein